MFEHHSVLENAWEKKLPTEFTFQKTETQRLETQTSLQMRLAFLGLSIAFPHYSSSTAILITRYNHFYRILSDMDKFGSIMSTIGFDRTLANFVSFG
jgi:hypothetical protein